jgi:hypothetical protein
VLRAISEANRKRKKQKDALLHVLYPLHYGDGIEDVIGWA